MRGSSVEKIYQQCYTDSVVLLQNNNKICVNVAGYEIYALVDTGSTISTINNDLFAKLCKNTDIKVCNNVKQCVLANGATVDLHKTVTVPIKLGRITFSAMFYVFDAVHIDMIIGCDLLKLLRARIDFKSMQFIHDTNIENSVQFEPCVEKISVLNVCDTTNGVNVVPDCHAKQHVLRDRVMKIQMADSDTTDHQKQLLIQLINKYELCFANNLMELGRTNVFEYDIELEPGTRPIRMKPYKCAFNQRDVITAEIQKLSEADLIRPAVNSRWGTPTLLVSKKNTDAMRMVQDCRKINEKTILQPYPMLDMHFLLADIGKSHSQYFSLIDLSNSYRQLPLTKRSQEIATMTTIAGDWSPTTCTFGLKNLPFVFTRLMETIFWDIKNKFMAFFQDDIIIYSPTFEQHIEHIEEVLKRLRQANLTAKPEKTYLCKKTIAYLGFTINKHGVATTDENVAKITKFPRPSTQKHVRSFLGISGFYRAHCKDYAKIAQPLYDLTKKQIGPFTWTNEAESAFQTLKTMLTTAPLLAYPDVHSSEPLILTVDSSSVAVGYVLSQKQKSDVTNKLIERPICYGSTCLRGNERKFGSSELELTGVCFAIKKLDVWLRGTKFILVTDHKSLTYMINKKLDEMRPVIARKVIFLQQYDFTIVHKSAHQIRHVDSLSRMCYESDNDEHQDVDPYIHQISALIEKTTKPLDACDVNFEQLNFDEIRKGQKLDKFWNYMYRYLSGGHLPTNSSMSKKVKRQKNNYIVSDHLLYHIWHAKDKNVYQQLCIPVTLRDKVLIALHDLKTTGHRGVFKMYMEAQKKVFWCHMYSDIQNYVGSCKLCMECNTGHAPKVPLVPLEAETQLFGTVHCDLLKFSKPSRGYNYILVLVDSHSRFVVLKELRNKTGSCVLKAIYKEWILKFGIMSHLIHDCGLEFINSWNKMLCELTGIKSIKTSAYRPQSNATVERQNRNIISILRRFVQKEPNKWSIYLPYVAHVINSSVSESTGYTPFFLVHGCELKTVLDVSLPTRPDNIPKVSEQAYKYWYENLQMARDLAVENMKIAKDNQKRNYDRHARKHNFSVGDKVFIKLNYTGEHDDVKLRQQYKGVYEIVKFISSTNVTLCDEHGKKLPRNLHINFLKKFRDRTVHVQKNYEDSDSDSDDTIINNNIDNEIIKDGENNSDSDSTIIDDTVGNHLIDQDIESDTEHDDNVQKTTDDRQNDNSKIISDDSDRQHIASVVLPFHRCSDGELNALAVTDAHLTATSTALDTPAAVTLAAATPAAATPSHDASSEASCAVITTTAPLSGNLNNEFPDINKILKQRVLPSRKKQYYVTWQKFPARKHRRWIDEDHVQPHKIEQFNAEMCAMKPQVNVISCGDVNTKHILNSDDWLSFNYQFELPITQEFTVHGKTYYFCALSMCDLYVYYMNYVVGNMDTLIAMTQNNNNVQYKLEVDIPPHLKDQIRYITPRIMYLVVMRVIHHDMKIADKLHTTNGQLIVDKQLECELYTTMLMFIREQMRVKNNLNTSINLTAFNNPIVHLYGKTVINDCESNFLLCSCLGDVTGCIPQLVSVILDSSVLLALKELFKSLPSL